MTYSRRLTHRLESIISTTTFRSLLTLSPLRVSNAACVGVPASCSWSYLLELMKMGWERRMDGESATRGARVRVELPNDSPFLSEPSNTSVQGPAATSIMIPEGEEGRKSGASTGTRRLLCVPRLPSTEIHMQTMIRLYLNRGETQWEHTQCCLYMRESPDCLDRW